MRIFLFLVLIYTPFCKGKRNWTEAMRKVFSKIGKHTAAHSKSPAYKTKMYCNELAEFTPQLCDNLVAREKCTELCGKHQTTPGKIFTL